MIIENYYNTLYKVQSNLELPTLKDDCIFLNEYIDYTYSEKKGVYADEKAPTSTKVFNHYNLLSSPSYQFYKLYTEIKKAFTETSGKTENFYIQAWVNVFKKGQQLSWHGHFPEEANAWHGYFCVDAEPSITEYKFSFLGDTITPIENKNNTIVIGKSGQDVHKTVIWDKEEPRITIAFDIVPVEFLQSLDETHYINHWLPL